MSLDAFSPLIKKEICFKTQLELGLVSVVSVSIIVHFPGLLFL